MQINTIKMNPNLVIRKDNDECLVLILSDTETLHFKAQGMHATALFYLATAEGSPNLDSLTQHLFNLYDVEIHKLEADILKMLAYFHDLEILSLTKDSACKAHQTSR